MNKEVNFEIAKLLKEKGFDEISSNFYTNPRCKMFGIDEHGRYYPIKNKAKSLWISGNAATLDSKHVYYAPTIAEVVMWLYEKHGIWIVINPHKGEDDLGKPFMEFDPEVWSFTNKCILHNTKLLYFNSPEEAYEAAIEYVLNNLV